MRRRLIAGRRIATATALASSLAWVLLGGMPAANAHTEDATLTGTWAFSSVVGPSLTLPTLVTFHADGTIAASDSIMFGGIAGFPNKITVLHGVWERTGGLKFGGTSLALVFTLTSELVGIARVRSDIRFEGDFDHLAGMLYGEMLPCATPLTCPDPTDAAAQWIPTSSGVSFSAARLERVPAGPLP